MIASYVLFGLLGLVVGSALTMVIDRVPDRLNLIHPGPRCPFCEHAIGPSDLVPVVSWLRLRGRCRDCQHPITKAYPAVELLTAALFVIAVWRFGVNLSLIPVFVLFSALIALSVVDLYHYRLPDRILFPSLGLSIVAIVTVSLARDLTGHIPGALIGAAAYFLLLFIPHLISPRGMGFGDVKLALLMGLFLGWPYQGFRYGFTLILYALFLGAVLGVVGGFALSATRRVTGRNVMPDPDPEFAGIDGTVSPPLRVLGQTFPFGPALAAGCIVVFLFSSELIQ